MIAKGKLFIIASNVDDSIKSSTPVYDITVYSKFTDFETYIQDTPIVVDTIVISERDLNFTSTNIKRLIELLKQPFLKVTGTVLYLVDEETDLQTVRDFLDGFEEFNIKAYQGDLTSRYISEIINGVGRDSDESEIEVVTYRMRASEYALDQNIKKYESDDTEHYETDEDQLSGLPDEPEPIMNIPTATLDMYVYYTVGKQSLSRALFTFTEAQYLAITRKTVFVESDIKFHRMTDIVLKSGYDIDYYDLSEFMDDPTGILDDIKKSQKRLIYLGCKERIQYDYNFVMDILESNLTGFVDCIVKECNYDSTPDGMNYTIVCDNTVPDIVECCTSLKFAVNPEKTNFVSVRYGDFTNISVTTKDMTEIVNVVLDHEDLVTQVVSFNGLLLGDDQIIYDVLGIIGKGNRRQLE